MRRPRAAAANNMFVVTVPASAKHDSNAFARKAEREGVDLLEVRGDLTPNLRLSNPPLPVLLALRGADPSLIDQLQPSYLDLELNEAEVPVPTGAKLILSYHNHQETPSLPQLRTIVKNLLDRKPDIVKIATFARSYADIVMLERLRESMPEGQAHVLLAMGDMARVQRLLSPLRNALTYTFIDDGEEAAPGQMALREYREYARCKNPSLYGLLGGPECVNSFSPLIHNLLFDAHNVDALYTVFPASDLADARDHLPELGVRGFSVTAPWKREIIKHADVLDDLAAEIQSVNTLVREGETWKGYNTDVTGILEGYPFLSKAKSVGIIGSGGVVPAVIYAARKAGVKLMTVYGRNAAARKELADYFLVDAAPLEALGGGEHDVLFWTIPDDIPVTLPPAGEVHSYAVDLRSVPGTQFLGNAEELGYDTVNGLPMLLYQALAQFRLFTGLPTDDNLFITLSNSLRKHGKQ